MLTRSSSHSCRPPPSPLPSLVPPFCRDCVDPFVQKHFIILFHPTRQITPNGLSSQAGLHVGDVVVAICEEPTLGKLYGQLKAEILRAGNELDLVVLNIQRNWARVCK
ncbi:unnamed protein product [Protopolystoma xenopodis]|uniref:PDZ domain-containing protein n=1 Tax=Protopolystoma xenopodis TaxID=117903 RepID=A0A448WMV2_9PLAT|nr:unnamed protein product [Protopolystoma xenopodis]